MKEKVLKMKINNEYLEEILKENEELKQYCVDIEDLLSFMLDYVVGNMQYDFNIDIDKNKLIESVKEENERN